VAFHSNENDSLVYARAAQDNPVDESDWTSYTLTAQNGAGDPSRMLVVDDVPFIVTRRADNNTLWFLAATIPNPAGPTDWNQHLLAYDVGPQIDLTARPDGGFALVWRDVHDSVYYAETDLDYPTQTSDWRVAKARFNVGTVGDVSVAVADSGRPYLAFVVDSDTSQELRVLRMAGSV
jgi:hypothetical protein